VSLYALALFAHSWLRWVALLLGIAVLVRAWRLWRGGGAGLSLGLHNGFILTLYAQILLGLLIYARLSPITTSAFGELGAAMGDSVLRFYLVEHIFGMTVGLIAAHVGYARTRRSFRAAEGPFDGGRFIFISQAVWLFVTLVSIPWPGMPYGRPLLRLYF
jgi:hypothetical protein